MNLRIGRQGEKEVVNTLWELRIKMPFLLFASDGLDFSWVCLRPSDGHVCNSAMSVVRQNLEQ